MESKAQYLVMARVHYKYTVGLWRGIAAFTNMQDAQNFAGVLNNYYEKGTTASEAKVIHESQYAPFSEQLEGGNDE